MRAISHQRTDTLFQSYLNYEEKSSIHFYYYLLYLIFFKMKLKGRVTSNNEDKNGSSGMGKQLLRVLCKIAMNFFAVYYLFGFF